MRSTNVSIGYSYLANSPLVEQVSYTNNTTHQMTTSRAYDRLNRLTSIRSVSAQSAVLSAHDYDYNNANQRRRSTLADGSFWVYEYDKLGQVKSGKKYWSDGTPVAGQQFEYGFDDIGNRTTTVAGGDENGLNLRTASYTPNDLNQYSSRTVPGAVDIMGVAFATNAVTVNGQAAYRKVEYFRKEVLVSNTLSALWTNITISAVGQSNVTGSAFVPKALEQFQYDADGSLTNDGRWRFTWDAENRLVRVVANTTVGPQQRIDFGYDHQSRRITKKVWNNTAGSGTPSVDVRFLYDGWNLAAELNATNNAVIRSFIWGLDISGSMQGAGGVGGLLAITTPSDGVHFTCFDGNGNVTALVSATNGLASAQYESGPFGEVLRMTGSMAKQNPFRFSTKYQDDETDLLYYGYRYYNASTGSWLSRDPIDEQGGENLYGFLANNPPNGVDFNGLCTCDVQSLKITSQAWIGGWPSWTLLGRRYSKQLRTQFELVLKPGSDKKCCLIKQNKKGRVRTASGSGNGSFSSWSADLSSWWDGSRWTTTWGGSWSGLTATWRDEPGFNNLKKSDFPVYFGSEIGPGSFEFNTYVIDSCQSTFPRVAEISWGMYIEYFSPEIGSEHY